VTQLPKVVRLTCPTLGGVVYDVFEQRVVSPTAMGEKMQLAVDLRHFPGRLFALAPRKLGEPQVAAAVEGDAFVYRVQIRDDQGQPLTARVPLRIRLHAGQRSALEIYRGTNAEGVFSARVPLPVGNGGWTLEVTELLGGQGCIAILPSERKPEGWLAKLPDAEATREQAVRDLLAVARDRGGIALLTADAATLSDGKKNALAAALKERGVVLTVGPALSKEAQPGVYLAAGHVQGGKALGEFLSGARDKGLFPFALSDAIPGPGRGFFTAVFGVRGYEEHGIALVGGDAAGLERTVDVFIDWLRTEPRRLSFPENPEPVYTIQ